MFLLKILLRILSSGKPLSSIEKKDRPIFDFTFISKSGLYHAMFLRLFLFPGFSCCVMLAVLYLISCLNPLLILKASWYAGIDFLNVASPDDISASHLLTPSGFHVWFILLCLTIYPKTTNPI